jgi:hypothetical protein
MPVEHIATIETRVGVDPADIDALIAAISALKGQIPGVLDVRVGRNFSDRAPQVALAGIVTLADRAALAAYGPHPAHQAMLRILVPLAKQVTIVDIEV